MAGLRLLLLLAWAAAALLPGPAAAERAAEAEVRQAVVFNLLLFVDWPEARANGGASGGGSDFRLCTVDEAGAGPLAALDGRRLRERKVAVVRIGRDLGDLHKCEAFFIDAASHRLVAAVAARERKTPLLVVAEGDEAVQHGATIGLSTAGGRMVFDVNLAAARAVGLGISSKLLRLARRMVE